MLHDTVCRGCGIVFKGGPRAWYCSECRYERKKSADKFAKERKRSGRSRPIGSVAICEICGKKYIVKSGLQKYCPVCAPEVIAKIDRDQGLKYYRENKCWINPSRTEKRNRRVCKLCGKVFYAKTRVAYCSDECRKENARMRVHNWRDLHFLK